MNPTTTTPTDLAIVEKLAIEKLENSLTRDSLSDLAKSGRRSLLLVDCSGSMSHMTASGECSKIDALRDVVETLRGQHTFPVASFGGRGVGVGLVDAIPNPGGMTPLAEAIEFGTSEGANHLVVITDGLPDSESAAFNAAGKFGGPIDVFYIDDGNEAGRRFARQLAKMTGGAVDITDMSDRKALASGIAGLLGDGSN